MILISVIVSLLFLGGWLSPFEGTTLQSGLNWIPGIFWLFLKSAFFLYLYLWIRATFPRYRYDQIMYLGWKILIPVALVWIIVILRLQMRNNNGERSHRAFKIKSCLLI